MSVLTQKVTLRLYRLLLIISFLGLALQPVHAFQEATTKKTKYEFTDTRISEADTLLKNRKYEEALQAYQTAFNTYEQENFYEGMVYAKERMGRVYRGMGKDSLSRITYSAAAALSREKIGPNHILESKAHLNNGIRAHRRSMFSSAVELIDSAMQVYKQSQTRDPDLYNTIVNYKFYTYYYSDINRDTLIKYLDERAKILDNSSSDIDQRVFLLSDYARTYFRRGEFTKAIAYGLEAIRIAEESHEPVGAFYYSDALFNLGRALNEQEDFETALLISNRLLEYTRLNNPKSVNLLGYINLKAVVLNGLERYEEAAREFHTIIKALENRNELTAFYRTTVMNLGVCYELMGDYANAKKYLNQSLELELDSQNEPGRVLSVRYKYLAQYFFKTGVFEKSLHYYDSALNIYLNTNSSSVLAYPNETEVDPTYEVLNLLTNKVKSLNEVRKEGNIEKSKYSNSILDHVFKTHDYLIRNRERLQASEKERLFLSRGFKNLYEEGINAAFDMFYSAPDSSDYYFNKVFGMLAISKSILFLEQSGELSLVQREEVPTSLKNSYYQTIKRIDSLESRFKVFSEKNVFGDSIRQINSQLMLIENEKRELTQEILNIVGESEFGVNSGYQSNFKKVSAMVNSHDNKGYIELFFGDKNIYVLCITSKKRLLEKITITDELLDEITEYSTLLSSPPNLGTFEVDLTKYQKVANSLYNTLIEPILSKLDSSINEVTIVPDDMLSQIPFEALISDVDDLSNGYADLSYLIKQLNINYALSSGRIENSKKKKLASKGLLGIGYAGSNGNNSTRNLGDLPGTEFEINFLKDNISGDYFLGNQGSKDNFLSYASDYDILHLAVHGQANISNRFESVLLFNGENGELRTNDLYVADLNARIAILSACESGIGQINKGEGTFSIARGFALVGVPSLVVSLWKVNDQVASELMVNFHKNLNAGHNTNQALANTKREYLLNSDKYSSHPYYWSAFVTLGEEVKVRDSHPWYSITLIAFGLVVIILVAVKVKRKGA